jgi:hypothetical protein
MQRNLEIPAYFAPLRLSRSPAGYCGFAMHLGKFGWGQADEDHVPKYDRQHCAGRLDGFRGPGKTYFTLKPGAQAESATYAGYIWRAKDERGTPLIYFVAGEDPGTAIVP